MAGTDVRIRVLGPTQILVGDVAVELGSTTQRRIVAALAATPGRPVRAEILADLAGLSPSALRVSISRLRKVMGNAAIATGPAGYTLLAGTDAMAAAAAFTATDRNLESLRAALAEWAGPPFGEFATEPWAAPEHARLVELHSEAVEECAEALLGGQRIAEAIAMLRAHIGDNPYRDRPRGLLIRGLAASGRTREALREYHEYRAMLVDESGLEPTLALQQIERRVATGWDGLDSAPFHGKGTVSGGDGLPLFGRDSEMATLRRLGAVANTRSRTCFAVIVGNAGIGKTTLLRAFAAELDASTLVVSGRCDEAMSVPLQPFRSVVDQLAAAATDEMLVEHAAAHGRILARVSPSFGRRVGPHGPAGADDATDRFRLFEAVVDLMRRVAIDRPLVVLLDDLHWAESTALQLLRHVARSTSEARALVVVGVRTPDEAASPDLRSALADLARAPSARIELNGLGHLPLEALIRTMHGNGLGEMDPEVVEALAADTAGNPLFATQLVRHWLDTGRFDVSAETIRFAQRTSPIEALPPTLRDIVWARLYSLGPDAPGVLAAATALGDDLTEPLLCELVAVSPSTVSAVIDAATLAGILTEVGERPGLLRFAHALVATAVADDIPASQLRRLHERAARALERRDHRSTTGLARIAHHWGAAGAPSDALRSALAAGDDALLSLAADEAVRWYRRALAHAEDAGATDAVRADLLVRLGSGLQRAGDPGAVETLLEAAELAQRCGAHGTLVEAAETTGRGFIRLADFAPTYLDLVEQALAVTPVSPPDSRARLLAMLASALTSTSDAARREQAALEAIALADASDDPFLVARLAHDVLRALSTPATDTVRADVAARAVIAAAASGDPYLRFIVAISTFHTAVSLGDAAAARRRLADLHHLVGLHAEPRMRWSLCVIDTFVATMAGRFEDADRLANDAVELGMGLGLPEAFSVFGSQFFVIGTFAGRYAEILPVIDQVLANGESATPFRLAHAIACAVSGRRDEAATVLRVGVAEGFEAVPHDLLWLTSIVGYAVLAIELGDNSAAAQLLPLLEPYAHQVAFNGATSQGPVSAYLGRLSSMLGLHDEADRHLGAALATATAFGWEYHRASTLVCMAESRLRRIGRVDTGVTALLDAASLLCTAHRIGWWADRVVSLRGSAALVS